MPSTTRAPWISDYDLYLLGEGTHYRAYEKMGAHLGEVAGQRWCSLRRVGAKCQAGDCTRGL